MTNLSLWVGIIGNVMWVLLFLSPARIFHRIVRNKSTKEFESIPYACALLNSALWIYYGIIKPNSILVAPANVIGIVVQTVYLILFLIYAPPKLQGDTYAAIVTFDVMFLGAFVSVGEIVKILMDGFTRMCMIGFLAATIHIYMYCSFLQPPMTTVATTERVEYIPFFPSLFTFFNGGVWTFYAVLVKDIFIGVPNALGFLAGTVQLLLYFKRLWRNSIIFWESRSQKESLLA